MPHMSGYDTKIPPGDTVEKVLRSGPMITGTTVQGTILARPGAATHMSRSGAIDGKNPDAQTSKPMKSHTIEKALN